MGLERTLYEILEDDANVKVCVTVYSPMIDCPIQLPFDVKLTTHDNNAGKEFKSQLYSIILFLVWSHLDIWCMGHSSAY